MAAKKYVPRCRQRGYRASYANRPLPGHGYITPTEGLAALLGPMIERLDRELMNRGEGLGWGTDGKAGARTVISHRAADHHHSATPGSMYRRMNAIQNVEFRTVDHSIAEAILLAEEIRIEDTELPCLPAGIKTAREMILIYHEEIVGERIASTELQRDARRLLEVARAWVHGADRIDEAICVGLELMFRQDKAEEVEAA